MWEEIQLLKSQYEGKCKGLANADGTVTIHSWKVGDEIFYQKEPKCICINEDCFNKQKGAVGTATNTSPKGQAVTLECRIANLSAFMDKTKGAPVEALPAYAGVWNATR